MHNILVSAVDRATQDAKNRGNPNIFLQKLSGQNGLHVIWHFRGGRRSIGFLLFHWHLVEDFRALRLNQSMGVRPLVKRQFEQGGKYYSEDADWDAHMNGVQPSKTLQDLFRYSKRIEDWHNFAHDSLMMVSGQPLHDASVNIFYPLFWDLHFFINNQFEKQLRSFASAVHLGVNTPVKIVQKLETDHHDILADI